MTLSIIDFGISSKAITLPPDTAWASCRSDMAALISLTPAHAVDVALGSGNNCNVAAVINPNVPSAPMNKCFRSYRIIFLKW